jgi:hypothetical protein
MYLFERKNQLGPNGPDLREEAYFDFGGAACCSMDVSELRRSNLGMRLWRSTYLNLCRSFHRFLERARHLNSEQRKQACDKSLLPRETTGSALAAQTIISGVEDCFETLFVRREVEALGLSVRGNNVCLEISWKIGLGFVVVGLLASRSA